MRKQTETALQKAIVNFLNNSPYLGCYVFRIKNTGTYDPSTGRFRKGSTLKGIPDIAGTTRDGRSIYIEVKVKTVISDEQKSFLVSMHKKGAICGIAYNIEDAEMIVASAHTANPIRKKRTWNFLEKEERNLMPIAPYDDYTYIGQFLTNEKKEAESNG